MLTVTVNGEPREIRAPDPTVAALIEAMRLTGKRIAVERNGQIVPRARYGETRLASGDRLEIVVAVGGG